MGGLLHASTAVLLLCSVACSLESLMQVNRGSTRLLCGWLMCSLTIVACGIGAANQAAGPTPPPAAGNPTQAQSAQAQPSPGAAARRNPAADVYERNSASVVQIISLAVVSAPGGPTERPRGTGSGWVLDDRGHIVTNNHVIEDASHLTVTFSTQQNAIVPATLVGRDPDNDLAVIRVDPGATSNAGQSVRDLLKAVGLGDSDRVTIGEDAIAMGSPLGLPLTVTSGIVSALRSPGDEATSSLELLGGAVQTDAAINPGNSGGPLFNAAGDLIGVNTAILSTSGGNIGVGFAIPVNVVKRVVPELIQHGCYRHPIIGVATVPLALFSQAGRQQLGLPQNQAGLLVQESSAGAQQAGIQAGTQVVNLGGVQLRVGGDIIVAIDSRELSSGGDLRAYIENARSVGEAVTLTILRDGQRQDVSVTLAQRPSAVCP
jgi:S1-C subfamily serine protease